MKLCQFLLIGGLAIALLGGCATSRYYDRDRKDDRFQKGEYSDFIGEHHQVKTTGTQDVGTAILYSAVAGMSVATNTSYYKNSAVSGKCLLLSSPSDPVGMPCANVVFLFLEEPAAKHQAPVGRAQTNGKGEFGLFVKEQKTYSLIPESARYRIVEGRAAQLKMGDELIIKLVVDH